MATTRAAHSRLPPFLLLLLLRLQIVSSQNSEPVPEDARTLYEELNTADYVRIRLVQRWDLFYNDLQLVVLPWEINLHHVRGIRGMCGCHLWLVHLYPLAAGPTQS